MNSLNRDREIMNVFGFYRGLRPDELPEKDKVLVYALANLLQKKEEETIKRCIDEVRGRLTNRFGNYGNEERLEIFQGELTDIENRLPDQAISAITNINKMKYPNKKEIINRAKGYIERIESEKLPREKLDTVYILKVIFGAYLTPTPKGLDKK